MASGGAMLFRALSLCLLAWYIPRGISQTGPKGTFFKPLFCDTSQMYPVVCEHNQSAINQISCEKYGCCYLENLCYKREDGVCGTPNPKNKCRTLWIKAITDITTCQKADCCFRAEACTQPSLRKRMQQFRLITIVGGGLLICCLLAFCIITKTRQLKAKKAELEQKKREEASAYLLELLDEPEEEQDKKKKKKSKKEKKPSKLREAVKKK